MKKFFLLLCAALLVLGSALPLVSYRLTRAVLAPEMPAASEDAVPSVPPAASGTAEAPSADSETFRFEDSSTGQVVELSRRDYVLGAVAAEMPVSWPDEALKAQAVAAHTYALYCRDHATAENGAWLTAAPARRQAA